MQEIMMLMFPKRREEYFFAVTKDIQRNVVLVYRISRDDWFTFVDLLLDCQAHRGHLFPHSTVLEIDT
jgi:hypothetical protein